jgi:riboflavin kinase/FMN adenylyltransferase
MPVQAIVNLDDDTPRDAVGTRASVVAIGNFDGVHLGHQAVLAAATAEARALGLATYVLTFAPHPMDVIGRGAPPQLTTLARRAALLVRAGVDRVFVRRFDAAIATWSPARFAADLLAGTLSAKRVAVGDNFRFGADRAGDLPMLGALGRELGFEAYAQAMTSDARGPLSSTRARQDLAAGDLDDAARVLGRPHAISGVVGHGAKRGRTIGFPTANLEAIPELLPRDGVYAVLVDVLDVLDDAGSSGTGGEQGDGDARALAAGVMNVGVRPTLDGAGARTVEVHLLDAAADLYGARLRVHIVARIRDERRFDGLDALKAQIADDARAARDATFAAVAAREARGARAFG